MKFRYAFIAVLLGAVMLLTGCGTEQSETNIPEDTTAVAEPAEPLTLTGENAPVYTIVRGDESETQETAAAVLLRNYLEKCGVVLPITTDWEKNPVSEYEIVVGNTLRAALENGAVTNGRDLGPEGYCIKAVGKRVYIIGGSPEATYTAVEKFMTDFLGYTGDPEKASSLGQVTVPGNYNDTKRQEFAVSSISVGEVPLNDYYITWDSTLTKAIAKTYTEILQDYFYTKCGVWMEIEKPRDDGKPAVVVSLQKLGQKNLLNVSAKNGNLEFACASESLFKLGFSYFTEKYFDSASGDVKLPAALAYEATITQDKVYYSEFGAKGDGVTNDVEAIVAAHEFANIFDLPVFADKGATYYIGNADKGATVKTDTDWGDATFIVDNNIPDLNYNMFLFIVSPDKGSYKLDASLIPPLKSGQANIGITLPEDSVIKIVQAGTKHYIRYGVNANDGSDQQELIVVDKNGNVDPAAPLIWDYDQVTSATVVPMDETVLTVKGGTFIVMIDQVTKADHTGGYVKRGINVNRSNVVVDGVKHYVKNDFAEAFRYTGFISVATCANVEVRNCTLTPYMTTQIPRETGFSGKGTYAISVNSAVNVTFKDCVQTIDITDSAYWGLMGSNFCKNITLDGCEFSRFDAHQGVANVTIKNSKLGYRGIATIGFGMLLVEDSTIYCNNFVSLRSDYGSTWKGDAVIRNCTWVPNPGKSLTTGTYSIINGSNNETHDFGYTCYMPQNITIENLHVDDSKATSAFKGVYLFSNVNPKHTSEAYEASVPHPYVTPKKITISGFTSETGKKWNISKNEFMFRNVEIIDLDAAEKP